MPHPELLFLLSFYKYYRNFHWVGQQLHILRCVHFLLLNGRMEFIFVLLVAIFYVQVYTCF
jgi:hypothetical protein